MPLKKLLSTVKRLSLRWLLWVLKECALTLGILLGGVAQQVVEYGHWPVLVVRAPYHGLRKILVVTDGSKCSEKAAAFLGKLSLPAGVRTYVMHVLPPIPPEPSVEYFARAWPLGTEILPPIPLENDAAQQDWLKEEEKHGQIIISQTIEELSTFGLRAEGVLLRGDAATEIIEHTNNYGIDLIVTGSRGLSTVKSWLLGSVSRKLVHYAGCSVLVVREIACIP